MLTASPGAAAGGFAGSWIATDTLDGSRLSLSVRGGGGHYAVREVDSAATVCGGAPASVTGPGTVDGDVLVVPVTLVCLPGGNILRERIVISFTYRPGTDSLIDNDGVVWRRAS
jgi:hypothetical protein